eukprot:6469191-Amphidinium_carterae.1
MITSPARHQMVPGLRTATCFVQVDHSCHPVRKVTSKSQVQSGSSKGNFDSPDTSARPQKEDSGSA